MTEPNEALVEMNELPEDEQMKAAKIEREQEKENKLLDAEVSLGKGKITGKEVQSDEESVRTALSIGVSVTATEYAEQIKPDEPKTEQGNKTPTFESASNTPKQDSEGTSSASVSVPPQHQIPLDNSASPSSPLEQIKQPSSKSTTLSTSGPLLPNDLSRARIPSRQYLDQNIVPILMQGLGALARDRPDDAIQYLADFLLREKHRFSNYNPFAED
ncbi:hypothetical protein WR25_05885 [Diploscapter pachys]|uniref:RIIa domain-containing protein n=1 Tax=Diploscapter pachys TaxID=2018661 RepID=A0A2A2J4P2_9BILA|nr:hypothetical protein WR25_05885 [Diploscapter pachys]